MKLVVIVLTLVMTVFTARVPEEGFHTDEGPHQRETPEQLEAARLKKNQEEAEMLARVKLEVRARKAAALAAKNNGKGGVTFADAPKGGSLKGPSNPASPVAGGEGTDTLSLKQEATIKALEPKTLSFSERENEEHPLSNLESVESELKRNLDVQKEIEDLLKKTPNDKKIYKENLNERLDKLEEQQKILINSQEFLAFCKDKTPPVTFTGSELENIFTILELPSFSDESLKSMSEKEIRTLKKTLTSIIFRINNAKDMPENSGKKIDILIKKYQNNSSIDFLNNYLETRSKKVSELLEKLTVSPEEDIDNPKAPDFLKDFFETREKTINNLVAELKVLLKDPVANKAAIDHLISEIKYINNITIMLELKLPKSVTPDAKTDYQQLLVVANKAGTLINGIDVALKVIEKSDFVFKAENLSGLADTIRALKDCGPEIQAKFNAKVLEGINKKQSSITSEQKQFVKTIIKQTETFSNLKAQADKAIAESNVAEMQKLQHEMRDVYENVFRNDWKDKDLETINSDFTQTMRSSINDTLKQFTETIKSIDLNHAKNKPSLLDNLKYKLKRLVVRAKNFPKIIYRSEDPANKDNFGLGLVDFKKAADDQKVERNKVIEFLKNPSDYLKGKLTDLGNQLKALIKPVKNINTNLNELKKSLSSNKISKEAANKQLALIEKSFKSLKGKESEFEKNKALIIQTSLQLAGNKPFEFEKDKDRMLTNEEVKKFIATSLGIEESEVFSFSREKLYKIINAKTEGVSPIDQGLRDLTILLSNDLLWAVELLKLKENPVVISDVNKTDLSGQVGNFNETAVDFYQEENINNMSKKINGIKTIINAMPDKNKTKK